MLRFRSSLVRAGGMVFSLALLVSACTSKGGTEAGSPSGATNPSTVAGGGIALDPSFGSGGEVTTSFSSGSDGISAIAVQPDGKIIVAGGANGSAEFALARYNPDGTLDTTFGDAGTVTTDLTGNNDYATAVAIQPDGKIVAAGVAHLAGSGSGGFGANPDFGLVRYNPDGTLDTTFGNGGQVTTSFTPAGDFVSGVAMQADGKIVAVGIAGDGAADPDFALARYNADGSLDATFGKGGEVTTDFDARDGASAVAIQADGKIIAAGTTFAAKSAGGDIGFGLARYDPDGSLDTTFGKGGTVVSDFTGGAACFGVAIQADGKIVASGGTDFSAQAMFSFARYQPNGTLDDTFGTHGLVTSDLPFSPSERFAIQPDGKIVAAGPSFTLVRFNPDGTPDTTFGTNGTVTTDFGSGSASTDSGAVAIQADGNVVVAGSASLSKTDSDFALVRYLAA